MATGTAHRLAKAGFSVIMTELPLPLAVRRTVSFAQAVYDGSHTVEGVLAQRTDSLDEASILCQQGLVPVFVGEIVGQTLESLQPMALVDATLAKENLGTRRDEAPVVIGLGPGFTAGLDVDAVIETQRGHDMGRVLYTGCAQPNTGSPGSIVGYTVERVIKAPAEGVFSSDLEIGAMVSAGDIFGRIDELEIPARIDGITRGLLMSGLWVAAGTKLGDIDPRARREYCYTISEKARAIGGGVLEALLHLRGGCANVAG